MNERVLITYASMSGSTKEIAEVVTETLQARGITVGLQPMGDVKNLTGYSALVLGIPIYMFHWHKDAPRFLSLHQKALTGSLPTAVFTGGPFSSGDEKEWQVIRDQVKKELARFPWFKPVSVEIVGGKFDPQNLHFPYNLIPALKQIPANDLRDWVAIRAWADHLGTMMQPEISNLPGVRI